MADRRPKVRDRGRTVVLYRTKEAEPIVQVVTELTGDLADYDPGDFTLIFENKLL